jgi:hypothetical protein
MLRRQPQTRRHEEAASGIVEPLLAFLRLPRMDAEYELEETRQKHDVPARRPVRNHLFSKDLFL